MNLRVLSIVLTCYLVQASADHSAQRWPQGSSYDKVERSALDAFLPGNEGPSPGRVHSDAREAMSLGYLGGNGDFGGDAPINPSSVRQRDEVPAYRRRYMDFLQERKVFQYYRDAEELQRVRGLATNENGDYSDIMFEYPSNVKEPLENKVETKEANDEVVKDKKQEVAKDDAKTSKQEKVQDETKITKGPEESLSSEDETNPTNSKDESKEKAADPAQEEKKSDENKDEIIVETESQVVEVEKVKAVAMEVEDPRGVMRRKTFLSKKIMMIIPTWMKWMRN
ncbi:gelsolin-related protein of 125 kDa-like [Clytia hemisphaerica]|uniref:Cnidarian restricted protein n=1 Tax=Clytia hemisphaerica TaxID=252671 RepID=A0A7M5UGW8_9CNID